MKAKQIPGVPQQKKGSFHDTESFKEYSDSQLAFSGFEILKERFLDINRWQEFGGKGGAKFKHFDQNGKPVNRIPQKGDLIRIDIPGPGNPETKGFDWVKIVTFSDQFIKNDELENILMDCVPTSPPSQKENGHIAHFYSDQSASVFSISRSATYIQMSIYGRNETPNMKTNLIGKIRNFVIAFGGMFGISKTQWKSFADGILKF